MTYSPPPVFERHAAVLRDVDGDTLYVDAELGCDVRLRMTVRLYGLNCPEKNTDAGKAAKVFVENWFGDFVARQVPLVIRTVKDKKEKYGRYLADLLPEDGSPSLCQALLESGHAVPYMI
jgi:micrococcal nuclease